MAENQSASDLLRTVALAQSVYYVPTGIWPIFGIRSFQWVTGPKRDLWLVKTVGLLLTVIGATVGLAAQRRRITPEIPILGIGTAMSIVGIDIVYVKRGVLRPIYLLDAVAELGIAAGWLLAMSRRKA